MQTNIYRGSSPRMCREFLFSIKTSAILVVAVLAFAPPISAQRARFGDSFVIPNARVTGSTLAQPTALQNETTPPNLVQPALPSTGAAAPGLMQQPVFDPFAIQNPVITPSQGTQPIQPPPYIYPPPATDGSVVLPGSVVQPYYGYPSTSDGSWAETAIGWPSQVWARLRGSEVYRLLERPRYRQTFLQGNASGRTLGLNETELATTLTLPNFLYTAQPLRISPGFIFHWWTGPNTMVTGADLPARTYSTYFAFDYSTPWDRRFGGELNFTIGYYSDFDFSSNNGIRLTGVGLGWIRTSNTTTLKFGIEYLDRVDIKLLPAFGLFIYPSPDLKLDLYFPRPKLARRLPSLGNFEVWGYIGGEYGGGSWTVRRIGGMRDQADVNDIRTFLGIEWMGPRSVTGFFEVGYVFDRNIVYRSVPAVEIPIDHTYMLRAGIAF